ncbi:hypothetical protein HanRHA438_Chr14g0637021 [Helianthus annuus]|nr:hypothetical protein HanRHA438_Chr14g0637021 [Helianthus annuus]
MLSTIGLLFEGRSKVMSSLNCEIRLLGMGIGFGPSPTGAGPLSMLPPPLPKRRPHRSQVDVSDGPQQDKKQPSPFSHTYTYNIYIYILGPSPHFHTSILFSPSSHQSYVAPTWRIILQGRTITIPHSLRGRLVRRNLMEFKGIGI